MLRWSNSLVTFNKALYITLNIQITELKIDILFEMYS